MLMDLCSFSDFVGSCLPCIGGIDDIDAMYRYYGPSNQEHEGKVLFRFYLCRFVLCEM